MGAMNHKEIIQFAIDQEVAAAELYEKYALIAEKKHTKSLLNDMALMERGHEKRLKDFLASDAAILKNSNEPIDDLQLSDFLVEKQITESSTLQDVFLYSINAEQKAFDLYTILASLSDTKEINSLFTSLSLEEQRHKHDLEKEYEKTFMQWN